MGDVTAEAAPEVHERRSDAFVSMLVDGPDGQSVVVASEPEASAFLGRLCTANGYAMARDLGDGTYLAARSFMYTWGLLRGHMGDETGYFDRYCYATREKAILAALIWDGQGSDPPCGWHRHVETGRRRHDGDPTREYVNW